MSRRRARRSPDVHNGRPQGQSRPRCTRAPTVSMAPRQIGGKAREDGGRRRLSGIRPWPAYGANTSAVWSAQSRPPKWEPEW